MPQPILDAIKRSIAKLIEDGGMEKLIMLIISLMTKNDAVMGDDADTAELKGLLTQAAAGAEEVE